jgi:hypothetical protein
MEVIFLENKYTKWYFNIIQNANNKAGEYVEKHHIIPRCIGGSDHRENLASLTAREHFVCHLLLTKMTTGKVKRAMCWAVGKFTQVNKNQNRKFTSWEYKQIRENISFARTGTKHSDESKKKMSAKRKGKAPWNKGKTGIQKHSAESNKKRSEKLKGRVRSEEFCKKVSAGKIGHTAGMTGKKHGENFSKQIKAKWEEKRGTGYVSPLKDKPKPPRSEEHTKNLANANKINGANRKGTHQKQLTCPHCAITGGAGALKRYHFDNCKVASTPSDMLYY